MWTVLHGMILGSVFLLAFAGAVADLYAMNSQWLTPAGANQGVKRLKIGLWSMSIISWVTVISGTWMVYIWYRAVPPDAGADLTQFPRYFLLSKETTKGWHEFGMEWKEHVAWIVPLFMTSIAYVVHYYGTELRANPKIRQALFWLLIISFGAAAAAGIFGAFINKMAATR
ncbi:MAG: hypothetical protein A2622_13540 [Bdellovibrionales bacterium RIFCSPHIGHO2_01_FULL_40_29]|nr:MAG: hypothetical protein A2622_13540 [Bdellovibrionales bacterium RIFCSPHIGHO2_01_FULL_40_29]OFZ34325.1 MAG: hypothetical protein A3D17_04410 [Bdellovibrionales bacterium RIFCSPHIGHO2_02_FULL_40_15]